MPRSNSSNWSVNDQITAARLQDINEDIDDIYGYGSDRLRVVSAASGTALRIDIGAGSWRVGADYGTYAGGTNIVVTNTATNYVEIDDSGTIQINTSNWTTGYGRLATVVCSGGVITGITIHKMDVVDGALGGDVSVGFGDGADGDVVISSNTTLAANKFYNNLTINNGIWLKPAGYIIWVKNTLTLSGGDNIISHGGNGGNGGVPSTGNGGAAGTAAHSAGALPAAKAGATGGAAPTGHDEAGAGGSGGAAETNGVGSAGAGGGAGGLTGNNAGGGGGGGSVTFSTANAIAYLLLLMYNSIANRSTGGNGGGGGGGSGSALAAADGGAGGGSGGNGGNMEIHAKTITGTGNIKANGGNGGNGETATGSGGGGGAGGSGGYILLHYQDKSGWSGTATAAGGTGGTKGLCTFDGSSFGDGNDGANGTAGIVREYESA